MWDVPEQGVLAGAGVLVVVPTCDEAQSLPVLLERLARAVPAAHVLVVDDASPDGTGDLADAAVRDDRVSALHRAGKGGLGAACRAGLARALADDRWAAVVEMDADGSHAPELLPALLAALDGGSGSGGAGPAGGADLVLGSRWVPGGAVVGWPWWRQALSRGTLCAHRAGLRVVEVPITVVERAAGRSTTDGAVVAEALWRITGWGAARPVIRVGRALRPARPRPGG